MTKAHCPPYGVCRALLTAPPVRYAYGRTPFEVADAVVHEASNVFAVVSCHSDIGCCTGVLDGRQGARK